jgi:transketolase
MPGLHVFRPADAVETLECWSLALARRDGPSLLALSRQDLAIQPRKSAQNLSARGGYELMTAEKPLKATLLATGSEVEVAVAARALLEAEGIGTRVVSMPCIELFEAQDAAYRNRILKPRTVRVAVEAGTAQGWERYVGAKGGFIGMSRFGASAPHRVLQRHFGITPEAVAAAVKERL